MPVVNAVADSERLPEQGRAEEKRPTLNVQRPIRTERQSSKELAELIRRETCLLRNVSHRVSVDWIMSGNRQDADTVGHDDVTTLANDLEAGLLQSSDSGALVHAGNFGILNRYFSTLDFYAEALFDLGLSGDIIRDRLLDVSQCLFAGVSL